MDLDEFLEKLKEEDLDWMVDDALCYLVTETVNKSAGYINDMGRDIQIRYLIKDEAAFNEKGLIEAIKEYVDYDG